MRAGMRRRPAADSRPGLRGTATFEQAPITRSKGAILESRRYAMVDARIIELLLMYFVMPLWIAAGLADWACHPTVRLGDNAGPKESLLHLLMLVEIGIPVCAVLFLQVNASIILLVVVAFVV